MKRAQTEEQTRKGDEKNSVPGGSTIHKKDNNMEVGFVVDSSSSEATMEKSAALEDEQAGC